MEVIIKHLERTRASNEWCGKDQQPISSCKRGKALISQKYGLSMQLLSMYCNSDCTREQGMKPIYRDTTEKKKKVCVEVSFR